MSKKQYFMIIDTETSMQGHVIDLGIIIADKRGNIHKRLGVLIGEYFYNEKLFWNDESGGIWAKMNLSKRYANYYGMIDNGERIIKSIASVNKWLEQAWHRYQPELTAYNLAFDLDKCQKSGINLELYTKRFCLWHLAAHKYAKTKKYLNFILDHHYFRPPTHKRNMTYITNAEVMAHFVTGNPAIEPHTALEDAEGWELPILLKIVNTRNWREKCKPYDWTNYQVKNHFIAKPMPRLTKDALAED